MEIKINSLTYKYLNNNYNTLEDINIVLKSGLITGIIGESGSGKTTLLNIITGIYSLKEKNITYDNNLVISKKDIGYMFQNTKKQFFCNTVREEIELSAKTYHYRINELDKRISDVLKIVDLDSDILSKNPQDLSNSEAKKVMLATILIYNPKVIILDEPTMNFDYSNKEKFIKLIKMLKNRYNKTIIIVSHDIDLLHKLVDDIVILKEGKVVLNGNKYDVFKNTRLLKKYGILPPNVINFSDKVLNKKGIKLGYRDEINDLIKDIYRNV